MGEVVDVSTAMERLCREMAECVVERLPASWCQDNGIYDGEPWSQCKGIARADIERRIAEADLEDDKARDSALGDWKAKADAMDETCRVLGVDSYNLAADAARSLVDEHCELKELREAGRVMPGGVSWPRYEDGEPVRMGDELDDGEVAAVTLTGTRYELSDRDDCRLDTGQHGARVERPAPKAVGADGLEVKPGDTVWLAKGYREKAGSHGTRRDGYLMVAEYNLIGASALEGMTVYETLDDSCVSLTARGSWCPASWLTHTAPCTDKDGAPIDEGDEVWTEDGCRWKVLGIKSGGHPVQAKCVEGCHRGKRRDLKWTWVSHERPDSWWRLREDVRKDYTAYWGCIGFCCDKCPALVDGKKPSERYDTAGCHTAEQLDLLARAERLAGVNGDER